MQVSVAPSVLPSLSSPLVREISGDGPAEANILVLTTAASWNDRAAKRPLSDAAGKLLFSQLLKAGVTRASVRVEAICERVPPDQKFFLMDAVEQSDWRMDCLQRIAKFKPNVIVPLGEEPLRLVAPQCLGIQKWHLSIVEGLNRTKVIPLLSPEYVFKFFKEIPFLTFGATRVAEQAKFPEIRRVNRKFIINPTLEESLAWIEAHMNEPELSADIETGQGQITCIGFSTDPREAICIPTLPKSYSPDDFHRLWNAIAKFLGNNASKVGQNLIYDTTYLSKYGILVRNVGHDTMICQKFLHPELPMGLDTVARLNTTEPYWKDEGKNWTLRQDVSELYYYNCKDASVTLEAARAQKVDLARRGLTELFKKQMSYTPPAMQMSWAGLPIDQIERAKLRAELVSEIEGYNSTLNQAAQEKFGEPINPKSPAQVKRLLASFGYRIPTKKGKETSDKGALLKLRLKHTESPILTPLIQISEANKRLSSYIDYLCDPDERLRFTLYNHGTESARWSCGLDPWSRGLNAQTVPTEVKSQFCAPEGYTFIEVDLKQAESRFVAWDGPVPKLQEMYRDGIDIHRFVASHPLLFNKTMDKISKDERQLGKKTGHAANYGMQAETLSTSCLLEMNLILSVPKAAQMLIGYHQALDGGVLRWQKKIEEEISRTKKLITPLGYQRYFYDRIGHDLFKEAYAYKPQNTVVTVINYLMAYLYGKPGVTLLDQIHDSLLLLTRVTNVLPILTLIKDQDAWNPKMQLSGGELRIPIEIKHGSRWSSMETVFDG